MNLSVKKSGQGGGPVYEAGSKKQKRDAYVKKPVEVVESRAKTFAWREPWLKSNLSRGKRESFRARDIEGEKKRRVALVVSLWKDIRGK